MLPYYAVHSIQQTGQIPNDPPQMGAKSTTTSNHPSTPQHGVNIQHYSSLVRLCMGQSWRPGLLLGQGYTVRRANVGLMLDQRRRRCSNIEPTLVQNIAWHPLQMISRRYTSSQMSADLICFTTMGVLEFGGHVVRGSSQRACLVRKCTVAADWKTVAAFAQRWLSRKTTLV